MMKTSLVEQMSREREYTLAVQ